MELATLLTLSFFFKLFDLSLVFVLDVKNEWHTQPPGTILLKRGGSTQSAPLPVISALRKLEARGSLSSGFFLEHIVSLRPAGLHKILSLKKKCKVIRFFFCLYSILLFKQFLIFSVCVLACVTVVCMQVKGQLGGGFCLPLGPRACRSSGLMTSAFTCRPSH